ncbi:MAG: ABC transporter permease subunit [Geminicoccaceae bacterium]
MLSRLIIGTRVSLSVGLVGVVLSLAIGLVVGGLSGFYGGLLDLLVQRVIEFLRSVPTIPLWMGLAAALPRDWPPLTIYFAITVILSLVGWTELRAGGPRPVPGALKTEDYVTAARLDGASDLSLVFRHMMPGLLEPHHHRRRPRHTGDDPGRDQPPSFLPASGCRPRSSAGGAAARRKISARWRRHAWLLWPAAAMIVAVLAMNFLGDGLRDADPYAT